MLSIPLEQVPSQYLQIVLDNQDCEIEVLTRSTGLFISLTVDGTDVRKCVPVASNAPCVCRQGYFKGSLVMVDTLGKDLPEYSGFGDRWELLYLDDAETAEYFPGYL